MLLMLVSLTRPQRLATEGALRLSVSNIPTTRASATSAALQDDYHPFSDGQNLIVIVVTTALRQQGS